MSDSIALEANTATHTTDTPQLLLEHHLKELRLPTILREYDKVARQCRGPPATGLRRWGGGRLRAGGLCPLSATHDRTGVAGP